MFSIEETLALYKKKEATPVEVLEKVYESIDKSDDNNPPLRSFLALCKESAFAEAEASTKKLKGKAKARPLEGVPIAIKDAMDVEGMVTTDGTNFMGHYNAKEDAYLVKLLRDAGAVIVGKTNLHEIGFGGTGINPHYGTAGNPHDLNRMPGGSSSGSASAIAAGLVPGAMGSDAGGSIRIPGSLCGVAGLKPTYGALSLRGMKVLSWTLDHAGPMASTVESVKLLWNVLNKYDEQDPLSRKLTFKKLPKTFNIKNFKIGICRDWMEEADNDVAQNYEDSIRLLKDMGAKIVDLSAFYIRESRFVGYITMGCEAASSNQERFQFHADKFGYDAQLLLSLGRKIKAIDYLKAQKIRTLVANEAEREFEKVDSIILPSVGCAAPYIHEESIEGGEVNDEVNKSLSAFTFFGNITGLPATQVPSGTNAYGMPLGIQVISPWGCEELSMEIASLIEGEVGWIKPPNYFN